jgi:hypothetical protein
MDLASIRALSWQRFETLVAEAYRRQGSVVRQTDHLDRFHHHRNRLGSGTQRHDGSGPAGCAWTAIGLPLLQQGSHPAGSLEPSLFLLIRAGRFE